MPFSVAAEAYDRYIGRYSRELSPRFLDFARPEDGPVLDVGCGPGSLTSAIAERFGAAATAAVDPSETFVAACRERVPGADVRVASAEALPFDGASFGGALSQLVLSFVREPERMMAELTRVVRDGGVVAACTFEASGFALVRVFWEAARRLDAAAPDDASLPFRRMPELVASWRRAGLRDIEAATIDVDARYRDFDDHWSPFAFGIGPAGEYLATRTALEKDAIRQACYELLGRPAGAFSLGARVLAIRGVV